STIATPASCARPSEFPSISARTRSRPTTRRARRSPSRPCASPRRTSASASRRRGSNLPFPRAAGADDELRARAHREAAVAIAWPREHPGYDRSPIECQIDTAPRTASESLLAGVAGVHAVFSEQLAQVLAVDLRLASGGRQVQLVALHQVDDVLALEALDELTLRFLERKVGAEADRRRLRLGAKRVVEVQR